MQHRFEIEYKTPPLAGFCYTRGVIYLYPTDTVYGLGVDARDRDAVLRLRELKGSGGEKHYSIAVSDIDMLRQYAEVTPLAER